ncbi:TonB-dependent receptor domain-containing protein [Runella slithyformis]|uniref:TonB-dependent receptor plug n=1 Tax=Runella slithyformis (strain ATCC 29530 / DSM 19594 / LMG 11500 / NCIMB 11436 / LSU 4) TaxID=761193 RepID=A0A7U3ZPL8_RUNSL|nr:TonB-dependent receptor [Runella slithyformis]AEI51036.1 TonB-dependent receptor plug [Runella slithyformis DSM 19594]
MKNYFYVLTAILGISYAAQAQFPGGGGFGGGGGRGGDRGGMGGMGQQQQQAMPDLPKGNGRVSGIIVDSASGKPVEYATVALFEIKTGKPIDGTVTDLKGAFLLKSVPDGEFKFVASFIGYKNFVIAKLTIGKGSKEQNLGNINLPPDVRTLAEVTVMGEKAIIEDKVDRLVYNAEKDISNTGGDAGDVLRKVPLLSVDLDGNVSMRGSENIRVLINGKPSTIVANSVADALKMIPSDQIKTVEVITSPSAKYDAEGSAGIINIITKKNTLQGITGSVDIAGGNRSSNLFGNVNLRTKKLGVSVNAGGRMMYPPTGGYIDISRQLTNGSVVRTRQENDGNQLGGFGNAQLSLDYSPSAKDNITLSVRNSRRAQNQYNTQQSYSFAGTTSSKTFANKIDSKNVGNNLDVNLDYTRKFDKENKEFSILAQLSQNAGDNSYTRDQFRSSIDGELFYRESNPNKSLTKERTLQVDYQDPLSKYVQVETGAKMILRHIESDFRFNYDSTGRGIYTPNPQRTNVFSYDQNVFAGYLSFLFQTKNKWGFKPGLRYEYTQLGAKYQDAPAVNLPNFSTLVPSITVSKSLKGNKTIRFSYNRRIQRPSIQFLNPNVSQSDPFNVSFGNPNLNPEYTNNFEVNLSTFIKTTTLNFSAYTRMTEGSIETVRYRGGQALFNQLTGQQGVNVGSVVINDNTLLTTFQNIGSNRAYGMNIFAMVKPAKGLTINGNVDVRYIMLNSPSLGITNQNWTFNLFGQIQYQLGKDWSAQMFAFGRARDIQLQGTRGGFMGYSFNLLKEFKKKQASLGFGAENFLQNAFRQRTNLSSNTPGNIFTQEQVNYMFNRGFRLTFRKRFGKMSFDGNFFQRKKSVNNDDTKQGGDNSGDTGGGQPAGGGGRRPGGK